MHVHKTVWIPFFLYPLTTPLLLSSPRQCPPYRLLGIIALLYPPPMEEGNLDVDESPLLVFLQFFHHRVDDVLDCSRRDGAIP